MRSLREIFGSRRLVLLALGGFSTLLWLATAWSIAARSTLFVILFGLTALCVSIYALLYAILSGGPKSKW